MKKIIAAMLACLICLSLPFAMTACAENPKPLRIVCTTFPQYDWVRQILGSSADNVELTLLLDNGMDLHSYQPTAADIASISECDLLIYVGGESDEWVDGVLAAAQNPNISVISMVDSVEAKTEQTVEGMQEDEHGHHHHDEAFTEGDIQARALSEFNGEWASLYPMLQGGVLDEFLRHMADEETPFEACRNQYLQMWACDCDGIAVKDDTITFTYADGTVASAAYKYAGYSIVYDDDGSIQSVRYQFETDSADAPHYVQLNDHGHKPGEVEHFHIYFGNEGFDALLAPSANPFFVPAAFTTEQVIASLSEHSHEHAHTDEHVWLSLRHAATLTRVIADRIAELDPANATAYTVNADSYIAELNALDGEYRAIVDNASVKTLLFGDRFPFRYLTDDYNLDYYAAFPGCSAETEASFETIVFLAGKLDELGLGAVCVIESSDGRIAQTIINNTQSNRQKIVRFDSLQSVDRQAIAEGASYIEVMRGNKAALEAALEDALKAQ